jgi:plastocyanin
MMRVIGQGLLVLFLLIGAAVPAMGDTHNVAISGFSFVPQDIQINVGDTVHWTWSTAPISHNVESGVGGLHDGNFRSGNPAGSGDFSVVFDQIFLTTNPMPDNDYPYYCAVHFAGGMTGSVTVNAPTVPAVSQWGLIIMTVLVLAAGTIIYRRRLAGRAQEHELAML